MTKKLSTGTEAIAVVSMVVGFVSLATVLVAASYLGSGWLADYLYSNTFEAQNIGPDISFWQFVGAAVLVKWMRGVDFKTTKKSD